MHQIPPSGQTVSDVCHDCTVAGICCTADGIKCTLGEGFGSTRRGVLAQSASSSRGSACGDDLFAEDLGVPAVLRELTEHMKV
ncbi:hypothetical protein GCM10009773_27640 [Williamsia serinedens]